MSLNKICARLICIFLVFQVFTINQINANKENWEEFYNQSFDYFYNFEIDEAINCLEKAKKLNSNNPAVYWRLTLAFWLKARISKEMERDVKDLEKLFNETFNKGVAICNLKSDGPEKLFYLGALYGAKSLFKQDLGQRNMSMIKDIKKCRQYLEKIKKTDDFYYEARSYLGIFNYAPIVMSKLQRFFIRNLGYKWSEEQGLQQIKDSIKYSTYCDDIKWIYQELLQAVTDKDKFKDKIPEAIELGENLLQNYPRNLSLKIGLIILYCKKGDLVEAKEMGENFYQELLSLSKNDGSFKSFYVNYLREKLDKILSEIKKKTDCYPQSVFNYVQNIFILCYNSN